MEKKNQNTNKKIIQTSNKQVHQMRDTRTKNASQKRSKKHRKKQVFGRQSIFAGGFCIVAALAIVIGIFVSNKTKTPYEKQNRFLRSIFHTVPGIGILLLFAFQCISKSMLINVVSHIRLLPLFFLQ